ncbi:MAG: hypothetical protein M1825_005958 [Sarcosagium campestre]|nr:MAG: hypothetical protein M1825_005958 [Sarcosagium campestre]
MQMLLHGARTSRTILGILTPSFASLTISHILPALSLSSVRHASHKSQGTAKSKKNGPGKYLGAKKTGGQYVIPGHIIFRQRGTVWHAGANAGLGRDHTIYATAPGYVRYYRDPARHPKRQYIGVALAADDKLPANPMAPRKRRLGMVATPLAEPPRAITTMPDDDVIPPTVRREVVSSRPVAVESPLAPRSPATRQPSLGKDYSYREANWEIGRVAERKGVKVRPFKRGDRFKAWRKSTARRERSAKRAGIRGGKGK